MSNIFRREPWEWKQQPWWRVCLAVNWGWAMACQPDGLPLVRVLSLPAVVLWSAWWLMTTLWRARAGRHGIPMYVCVYVWERAFTCCTGGPLFGGFQCEGVPPPPPLLLLPPTLLLLLLFQQKKEEEERCLRRQGWLREDREGGQTKGIRKHTQ